MTHQFRFTCELSTGLHARPASLLAETVRRFHSAARVVNEETQAEAEARSVLSVIALDVQRGQSVLVEAAGDDAAEVIEAVRALVAGNFGEKVGAGELAGAHDGVEAAFVARVPRPLRHAHARIIEARPVSEGIGIGRVVVGGGMFVPEAVKHARAESPESERRRVEEAFAGLKKELERQARGAKGAGAEVAGAHLSMVEDPALRGLVDQHVEEGAAATCAVYQASRDLAAKLGASTSAYIRERVADVEEIARRLIGKIDPALLLEPPIILEGPSVLAAESLGVGQLMQLERANLRGLVFGPVGKTSHLVIVARSLQIPTVIGVDLAAARLAAGSMAVVDAVGGFVVPDAGDGVLEYYRRDVRMREARRDRLRPVLGRAGATKDGRAVEVAANAASAEEIAGAIEAGADSIGLLRTEMLFLDREEAPSEEEQYWLYRAAVEAANGGSEAEGADRSKARSVAREVIIRTLDIGGDKPAPYIHFPKEENPFLGVRGIRLYQHQPDLLRSQLRAICRASAYGPIKVMAPMVATVGEARWFCERIAKAQAELGEEGIAHDPEMPVGVMVEVPAVATIIDQLASMVDFLSIGTNDLCQYWMAADRGNPGVAALNNVLEPSFLRVLERICTEAGAHGVWIGMCGEMAGNPRHLPLLVGMGLNEVSMAAPSLARVKPLLATLEVGACREVLKKALACETAEQVWKVLDEFERAQQTCAGGDGGNGGNRDGMLDAALVVIDSDAQSKDEAIHELVGALHVAGRADDPRAVEEAVWAREDEGKTGFGHGFALPHAKTDAVRCQSIGVARLRRPVEWETLDGEPVKTVIMLTVRESDAARDHLKLLAKLARRLMHEDFRAAVEGAPEAAGLVEVLRRELEL